MFGRRKFIRIILIGTCVVGLSIIGLLMLSMFVDGNSHVEERFYGALLSIPYLFVCFIFYRRKLHGITGVLLLLLYLLIAIISAMTWGINTPFGILLFAFAILLSSVMFDSRFIIPTAAFVVGSIALVQAFVSFGIVIPDTSSLSAQPVFGDVLTYSVIFGVFALLGWLSGTELERLLKESDNARTKLKKQKDAIEHELQVEKDNLKSAYIQDLALSHEFVKIGQESAMLLHDISNQLSILSLDLGENNPGRNELNHAKETLRYLDELIRKSTQRIKNKASQKFYIASLVKTAADELQGEAKRRGVKILIKAPVALAGIHSHGDPEKLRQILHILFSNAIQAYTHKKIVASKVYCSLMQKDGSMIIKIKDFGVGIKNEARNQLFSARHSSKINGNGLGLYIARQIIEQHFHGSLVLSPKQEHTEFIIRLPTKE